jgi:uncharacterized iron-regulated membrane protein
LIARLHFYAGLLTLANLMLYAVVGIASLFNPHGASNAWEQHFTVPVGQTDRETAEQVIALLGLSLATPVHDFNIAHDSQGRLVLDFYHANGRHKVTVLDNPARLRIEQTRAPLSKYLATLHVTTAAFRSGDWRMRMWAWWNEFAMWCLLLMTGSGVWIWFRRRQKRGVWRRTHRYTALGLLALLAIYELSAVQMAHRAWLKSGVVLAWMDRVHRTRGGVFAPAVSVALLLLIVSGLYLWWRMQRERVLGLVLLSAGLMIAGGLALWMRLA